MPAHTVLKCFEMFKNLKIILIYQFGTSKSAKVAEIITFEKVDFFDKKVSFATVCAHVRLGEPRLAVKLIYIYSTLTLTCKYASKQLYYTFPKEDKSKMAALFRHWSTSALMALETLGE